MDSKKDVLVMVILDWKFLLKNAENLILKAVQCLQILKMRVTQLAEEKLLKIVADDDVLQQIIKDICNIYNRNLFQ